MTDTLPIQLIVGLGNPGSKYHHTRHNAGLDWVLALANSYGVNMAPGKSFFGLYGQGRIEGQKIHLLIPTTFMNLSGLSVQAVCGFYKLDNAAIMVAHDELDLPPGIARFKQGGGHGGHNGLRDIINKCGGDKSFYRLRLGIGHPSNAKQVTTYVLKKAPNDEFISTQRAMDNAIRFLPHAIHGHWQQAMNSLHSEILHS